MRVVAEVWAQWLDVFMSALVHRIRAVKIHQLMQRREYSLHHYLLSQEMESFSQKQKVYLSCSNFIIINIRKARNIVPMSMRRLLPNECNLSHPQSTLNPLHSHSFSLSFTRGINALSPPGPKSPAKPSNYSCACDHDPFQLLLPLGQPQSSLV